MYDAVAKRLKVLGYAAAKKDRADILSNIARAEQAIKSNINRPEVPEGLWFVWVDMAAGLYLSNLKATGRLAGFEFPAPTKTIAEGDTSVSFAVDGAMSAEARFDAMLDSMINPPQERLAAYRRVIW